MQKTEVLSLLCALLHPASQDEIAALRERILRDEMPWIDIIALANSDYLIPALYAELEEKQLLEVIQDEQLKGYMREVNTFNTERNHQILEQLKDLVAILKPLGIAPFLLKGSVVLSEEDYPSLGMRSMTDIDVMVDEKELQRTFEALQISGYSFVNSEDQHKLGDAHHHLEAMQKDGMPAALELHRHAVGGEASEYIVYARENMQKSTNAIFQDVDILLPTYRLYHAFLHTELQHEYHKFKYLALRHLYDFTVLTQKYREEIDWRLLRQLVVSNQCKEVLDDYLYLAKMLFSLDTPLTVENRRTRRHYATMLKSFELEGTFLGKLYPISVKFSRAYSYKRLQKIYSFNSIVGYLIAVVRRIGYHSRTHLFKKV